MFEIVVTEKISKSKLHLNRMVVQIDRIDDSSITPVFGEKHYGKYKIHEIKAHWVIHDSQCIREISAINTDSHRKKYYLTATFRVSWSLKTPISA